MENFVFVNYHSYLPFNFNIFKYFRRKLLSWKHKGYFVWQIFYIYLNFHFWWKYAQILYSLQEDFFLNFILFFNFTILYWFCHISTWICHRYTRVPHPEPSSLLPPCTIPLGRLSAPAPSILYHASSHQSRFDAGGYFFF